MWHRLHGNGLLDWLAGAVINTMTIIFHDTIAVVIGNTIKAIIDNALANINGGGFIQSIEHLEDLVQTTDLRAFLDKLPPGIFN